MQLLRSPCPELHDPIYVEHHGLILSFDYRDKGYELMQCTDGVILGSDDKTWQSWIDEGGLAKYIEKFNE